MNVGWTWSKYRSKAIEKGKKKTYGRYYFVYTSHYSPKRNRCYVPEKIGWEDTILLDEYYLSAKCFCDYLRPTTNPLWEHWAELQRKIEMEAEMKRKKEARPFIQYRRPPNDAINT